MSTWVGIDGDCDCDDLIQDGTEQAWDGSASYFAWVEFIPEDEVEVNLAVSPGDVILAYSWVSEKSGVVYGNYTLGNENTGQSISTSIKILPDYAYSYMDEAYYWRTGQDGFPYSEEVNQTICMTNLSNCTKPISEASELGSDAMLFTWVQYDN
jgi:hypothetical protein